MQPTYHECILSYISLQGMTAWQAVCFATVTLFFNGRLFSLNLGMDSADLSQIFRIGRLVGGAD